MEAVGDSVLMGLYPIAEDRKILKNNIARDARFGLVWRKRRNLGLAKLAARKHQVADSDIFRNFSDRTTVIGSQVYVITSSF